MKKLILLLLCGVFMSLLGACEKGASTESSSSIENNSSVEQSESIESGDDSDIIEGWEIIAFYQFKTFSEFIGFYDEFIKLNEERYCFPQIQSGVLIDTVSYQFETSPVPFDIAINNIYIGVEFPEAQTMEFNFSKMDDSVVGVHKSVTVRGEVFDVSEETLVGNKVILVQTDDEGREYNVCLGETILCSFEIGMTGYDNKTEYLQLIESGFNFD